MANPNSANPQQQQAAGDGCIPITNTVGALARKLGGELWQNKNGTVVLKGLGASETAFPDEASALHEIKKRLRAAAMNAEATNRIKEIIATKAPLPVTDWEGLYREQMGLSKAADAAPGGERPPFFSRPHAGIGQVFKGGPMSDILTRGHATLMQLGDVGQHSANAVKRYDTASEMLEIAGESHLMPALNAIDAITNMQDIHEGNIPQEAQQLHDKFVKPLIDAVQGALDMMGGNEDVAEPNGHVKWHGVTGDQISNNTMDAGRKAGYIDATATNHDFAAELNKHETPRRRDESPQQYQARKVWMQTVADGLSRDANHVRSGGYNRSYKATMLAWNRATARKVARAAVFGPNDERIAQANDRLTAAAAFGDSLDKAAMHDRTMKSVLGDAYVPRSTFDRAMSDLSRFPLSASGSRHLAQTRIALMQVGYRGTVRSLGKELFHPAGWRGALEERSALGITAHQSSHFYDQHPSDAFLERSEDETKSLLNWAGSRGVTKVLGIAAKASTAGLHVFLNFDRRFAHILARNTFDSYWEKGLKGDRDTLAHLADTLGFGDPRTAAGRDAMVEQMRGLDVKQTKNYYMKRRADITGTTFHASDLPGITRLQSPSGWPVGKWLTLFKTFKWNIAHNVWNQVTSDNYSLEHRIHVFARLAATTPLSAIDPIIRHAKVSGAVGLAAGIFGFGAKNTNSEMAYKSFKKALENHEAGSAIYAFTMLMINDATLGVAGDHLQAINADDYHLWDTAIAGGEWDPLESTCRHASLSIL